MDDLVKEINAEMALARTQSIPVRTAEVPGKISHVVIFDAKNAARAQTVSRFFRSATITGMVVGSTFDFKTKVNLDLTCCQIPREFEKATGMTGIAGQYHLPEGLSAQVLQNYTMYLDTKRNAGKLSAESHKGKFSELVAALEGRNPEIATLKYDRENIGMLRNVIHGVASAFPARDIQNYLDGHNAHTASKDYLQKYDAIGVKLKSSLSGWMPSPSLLDRMAEKVLGNMPKNDVAKMANQNKQGLLRNKAASLAAPRPPAIGKK